MAPDGKTNPEAELEATLASFFAASEIRVWHDEHPQCAFAARFAWLVQELGLDPEQLPRQPCPSLAQWRSDFGPAQGVSLIFPEAYMNNPASMFGHTLLRIDRAPPDADEDRRDLLAYAVNFAAETGDDGGALFAMKGLTGSYPGYFKLWPYYEKVKEYSDWESRDIWEYRLDLGPDEVERLLLHVWELRGVRFDYYFFDENCSYQLLGLLETARPGLELQEHFRGWAIPADTVREALRAAKFTTQASFRPSAVTRISAHARALTRDEQQLARGLASFAIEPDADEIRALGDESRARVLELAYDLLRHGAKTETADADRPHSLALLRARSRIPLRSDPADAPPIPAVSPDQGHETARLRVGGGARDGRAYVEARLRPAFHDLLDPDGGYTRGAQIDFLDVALRWYPAEQQLRLQELTVLDIVSLAPRDALFHPISWQIRTGVVDWLVPHDGELHPASLWRSAGGAGLTTALGPHGLAYAFAEASADVSSRISPAYAIGPGASAGVIFSDLADRYRLHLSASATRYVAGDVRTALSLALDQRLRLSHALSLELRVAAEHDFGRTWLDGGIFLSRYF